MLSKKGPFGRNTVPPNPQVVQQMERRTIEIRRRFPDLVMGIDVRDWMEFDDVPADKAEAEIRRLEREYPKLEWRLA